MKKTVLYLILSFLAVAVLFSATAFFIQNSTAFNSDSITIKPSDDYEIIDFVEPEKKIYYLSDVETKTSIKVDGDDTLHFQQCIDLDGTGMEMTVKHKKSGEVKTYKYNGYYFELDGEQIKCEGPISNSTLSLQYETKLDTILTPANRQAKVLLVTDNGDHVLHDWSFSLMCDPNSNLSSHSHDEEDVHVEKETTEAGLPILPDITRAWHHSNQPDQNIVTITNQDDNSFTLNIVSIKDQASQVATADVPITLKNVHKNGSIVAGECKFEYTDSYGNKGYGVINVHEDAIILVIQEVFNTGASWSISNATGVYY